jgi:M6 family metalloprotease-like protein
VELKAFGPYLMPGKDHEYAMEFQGGTGCPAGDSCNRNIRTDGRAAWVADVGSEVPAGYDFVYYLSAGQDESGTWQEFGMMKFRTKEDVTDDFGPPDPALPNWSKTRYVDWTSWAAGSSIWPNAGGGSSTQAESSGQGVYAHELSHILGIGDNYNNPYGSPPRRDYSGRGTCCRAARSTAPAARTPAGPSRPRVARRSAPSRRCATRSSSGSSTRRTC